MKKISAFIFALLLFQAMPAFAQSQPLCPPGNFGHLCNLKAGNAGNLVGAIATLLIIIGIILSLFFLVWGGVRYISSGGDKGKIDQARSTIIAAIVGLIISLLAFFIINLILVFVTGQGLSSLALPTLLQ